MREPAVSGRFYPSSPAELASLVDSYLGAGEAGSSRRIRGAMAPHAGIQISGPNAANAFRRIRGDGLPELYVVIGPDHHGTASVNTFSSEDYRTPLGVCRVHEEVAGRLAGLMPDAPRAQAYEHSIEVELPFIQRIDPDPRVVPVLMSDQSPGAAEALAAALREACEGFDALFLASTDLSHYVPKERALRQDSMVLDRVAEMDWRGLYSTVRENRITMCGYGPTATVMMLCGGCRAEGVLHTDSHDALGGDPSSVVGYGSAVFADVGSA